MLQELLTVVNILISAASVGVSLWKYIRYSTIRTQKKATRKAERNILRAGVGSVSTSPVRASRVYPVFTPSNNNSLQSIPEQVGRVSSPELERIDRL